MQYEVTLTCKVTKIVICENCTEEQARAEPFRHAIDERENGMIDWEIDRVEKRE